VAANALDRLLAGCGVARGIEVEAEALAEPPVSLRPELRPRPGDREVDVEENRPEVHVPSSNHCTVSRCVRLKSLSPAHATVCAIAQPRARSRSRSSSDVSRSKRCKTSRFEWPS